MLAVLHVTIPQESDGLMNQFSMLAGPANLASALHHYFALV